MAARVFQNPFRPGAGHPPPYLAGRQEETKEFIRLLEQSPVFENLVLTGLRGVGKTVLLDTFKPIAREHGWAWVGTEISEAASLSDDAMAMRVVTDLSTITSNLIVTGNETRRIGFGAEASTVPVRLDYELLTLIHQQTPGLTADKLKHVLEFAWNAIARADENREKRGIVFAYDEAQNLSDHAEKGHFPLSLLLDVFQSLQRKGVPVFLALAGLPTLFPKLVDARTYAERMFRVVFLGRLGEEDSRAAIVRPVSNASCPVKLSDASVKLIIEASGGYPYFIQYICRETYDAFLTNIRSSGATDAVPIDAITRKLDSDFFAGRWARVTDRQRDLLGVISGLSNAEDEFTVQEIVAASKSELEKSFSSSHVNQMLSALSVAGLVYKNRHGKYSFAVPLFSHFVRRQIGAQ